MKLNKDTKITILFVLIILGISYWYWIDFQQIKSNYGLSVGKIVGVWSSESSNTVRYRYEVDGISYLGEQDVGSKTFTNDCRFFIAFAINNPSNNYLDNNCRYNFRYGMRLDDRKEEYNIEWDFWNYRPSIAFRWTK